MLYPKKMPVLRDAKVREGGIKTDTASQTVRGRWSSTDCRSGGNLVGKQSHGARGLGRQVYLSIVLVQTWKKEGEAGYGVPWLCLCWARKARWAWMRVPLPQVEASTQTEKVQAWRPNMRGRSASGVSGSMRRKQ